MNTDEAFRAYRQEKLARDTAACRKSFYYFFKGAWAQVDPSPFVDNWHLGVVAEYLEALKSGEIRKLAINVPPATGKSLIASVAFPAWVWADDSTQRFFNGSYEQTLAKRDAGKSKMLMRTPWYTSRFGDIIKPGGSDSDYKTIAGGWRFAFGMGSFITGRHPDYHIIDDPTDPHVINVDALEKAIAWRKSKLSTRRRNPAELRQLLIMQRVHDLDMAAHCIEEEGFCALRFPMRRSYAIASVLPGGVDPDPRAEGELLWPERYPEETVSRMETVEMGPTVAAAQFQQDPVPEGGAIFTSADLGHEYRGDIPDSNSGFWLISCDFAFKGAQDSDFVSIQVWCCVWPRFYLVHRYHRRVGFVDSVAALKSTIASFPYCNTILVEDKANGPAVVDQLKEEVPGIVEIEPEGDKVARAYSVQGFFRAGNVFVPADEPWMAEYRKEMQRFPKAPNDDDVDATTQALRYFKGNSHLLATEGKWAAAFGGT